MINLREFLKQGSLFTELNSIELLPFSSDNPLLLDKMLIMNHGERIVFTGVIGATLNELAQMINAKFSDKWKQLILIENTDFVIGAWNGRKLTETITETENRNNTSDSINKVSAYNSDVMINNDGATGTGTETVLNEKVRTLSDSTGDLNNAYNHLSLQQKNNIIDIVFNDVNSYLTLSIY